VAAPSRSEGRGGGTDIGTHRPGTETGVRMLGISILDQAEALSE
jgi:hypothetical protein